MISFKIFNRFSGDLQFTAKIDCPKDAPDGVKVGLSVKWAIKHGASLVGASLVGASLVGASLVGASLDRASLDRASLDRASLDGASLVGALVRNDEIATLLAIASRVEDPYTFFAFRLRDGRVKIMAGCRWFTIEEYREHVGAAYPGTSKAVETLAILDFIETRAASVVAKEPAA